MAQPLYFKNYPPRQAVTFHGLLPCVKYRLRVRAVDGEGNVGPYSNPVDIIAGLGSTSQPTSPVASLVVTDYPLGVKVTWNAMTGAKGYEVYSTKGAAPGDPDPSNKQHLIYRGNSNELIIKAENDDTVKVKVLWYDQYGQKSTGIASGQGKALDASGN